MSPELEQAIKERIGLGHSKEQISEELRGAGYDDATINAVYAAVSEGGPVASIPSATLPGAGQLFVEAWKFMVQRLDLVALFAVLSLVVSGATLLLFGSKSAVDGLSVPMMVIGAGVGLVVVLVAQIALQLLATHAAFGHAASDRPSLNQGWRYTTAHLLSWIWLATIVGFVLLGGFALLFIPGIIASIYITFALLVFVDEGTTGLAALERSHQLVRGNFWAIIGRLLLFGLMVFGIALGVGVILGFSAWAISSAGVAEMTMLVLSHVVEAALAGFATLLGLGYTAQMYTALKQKQAGASHVPAPRVWYQVLGWIGLVMVVLIGFSMGFVAEDVWQSDSWDSSGLGAEFNLDIDTDSVTVSDQERAEIEAFIQEYGDELDTVQN